MLLFVRDAIVRHHEIIPQFEYNPRSPGLAGRLGRGLTMLAIGLAKKVIVADEFASASEPCSRRRSSARLSRHSRPGVASSPSHSNSTSAATTAFH